MSNYNTKSKVTVLAPLVIGIVVAVILAVLVGGYVNNLLEQASQFAGQTICR